jgi:hypothetical protein
MKGAFGFFCNCVMWDKRTVDTELVPMIENSVQITRRTFVKRVNKEDLRLLKDSLGYDKYFPMSSDWHVTYYKSKINKKTVYFFRHSAIEYVFV